MSEIISQVSLADLDVYGRSSPQGGALVHYNDMAISNSIVFYLTSKRGSYLYKTSDGGLLDDLLFKLNNSEIISLYITKISKKLKDVFRNLIQDIKVKIYSENDNSNRTINIEVYYTSIQTNQSNQLLFYLKPKQKELQISYTDVYFEGDNLLAFVVLKKEDMPEEYNLIKNEEDGYWYWGTYRFINFNEDSQNFDQIFSIINN